MGERPNLLDVTLSYLVAVALSLLLAAIYLLRAKLGLVPFLFISGAIELAVLTTFGEGESLDSSALIFLPVFLSGLLLFLAGEPAAISQQLLMAVGLLGVIAVGADLWVDTASKDGFIAMLHSLPQRAHIFLLLTPLTALLAYSVAWHLFQKLPILPLVAGLGAGLACSLTWLVVHLPQQLPDAAQPTWQLLLLTFGAGFCPSVIVAIFARGFLARRVGAGLPPPPQDLLDIALQKKARLEGLTVDSQKQPAVAAVLAEGMALTDKEGQLVYVNGPFQSLFAKAEDALLGQKVADLVTPRWQDTVTSALASLMAGSLNHIVLTVELADGDEPRWIELSVVLAGPELARQGFCLWLAQDITDRQQLNSQLVRSNYELTTITGLLAALLNSTDSHYMIVNATKQLAQLLGGDFCGFYRVDWLEGLLTLEWEQGHTPEVVEIVKEIRLGEGFSGWVAATSTPVVIGDIVTHRKLVTPLLAKSGIHSYAGAPCVYGGRCLGVIFVSSLRPNAFNSVGQDLLQRLGELVGPVLHRAEQLEARSAQLADLTVALEEGGKGVLLLDGHLRVLYASEEVAGLLNIPVSELTGSSVRSIELHSLGEKVATLAQHALESEGETNGRWQFGRPVQNYRLTCKPVGSVDRQRVLVQLTLADQPYQTAAPPEGIQRMAVISYFSASIEHELNNLLGPLQLRLELLDAREELSPEAIEDVEEALASVEDLKAFLAELGALMRRDGLNLEPVNLADVARAVLLLCGAEARRMQVSLKLEVPDDLPPANADPLALQELLLNLVSNAFDAMPEGGTLTVLGQETGEWVQLLVSDTGQGIAPEHQAFIFEPYFSTKGQQATGLGLHVCARLAEEMGGRLSLEGAPGEGATALLSLPKALP